MMKAKAVNKGNKKGAKKKASDTVAKRSAKALKTWHVARLCAQVESQRLANGRIPRGTITKVVDDNKPIYTWLTIDIIKKGLKKQSKRGALNKSATITDISDLTDDTAPTNSPDAVIPLPDIVGIPNPDEQPIVNSDTTKKAGRSKGSTIQASRDNDRKKVALINDIATSWKNVAEELRSKKNALDNLIEKKKEEHGLPDLTVEKGCIQQRLKRNKLICTTHTGTASPMAPIEEHIVALMVQMAKMRQPLNVSEGLALANSLVEGTKWEDDLISFKERRGWKQLTSDGQKKPLLGKKWYKGFWKRYGHLLEKKKGQKFSKDRAEWSIYRNFLQMYDEVYDAMVVAGVAKKLDFPIWVKHHGIETSEADAFGRMATHTLCRPDYVIFVDEVGCNTSQEGDGAHGGERKIVGRGTVPKESATTNDNHFTVLGFTSASGEPIMCGIIIEGSKIRSDIVTGMDIFAKKIGEESDDDFIQKNTGPGKLFPCGPKCTYRGIEVPCMVACSESGSISSEILVQFLTQMDQLNLFPRDDGLKPFLLLDGHGSRLELPFLTYVNDENHPWVVCIGVPYGTSYWQVGDSSEQNGSYKMAIAKAKKELVLKKQRQCFSNAEWKLTKLL